MVENLPVACCASLSFHFPTKIASPDWIQDGFLVHLVFLRPDSMPMPRELGIQSSSPIAFYGQAIHYLCQQHTLDKIGSDPAMPSRGCLRVITLLVFQAKLWCCLAVSVQGNVEVDLNLNLESPISPIAALYTVEIVSLLLRLKGYVQRRSPKKSPGQKLSVTTKAIQLSQPLGYWSSSKCSGRAFTVEEALSRKEYQLGHWVAFVIELGSKVEADNVILERIYGQICQLSFRICCKRLQKWSHREHSQHGAY